ncbi:group I truncated hemoglobin [Pleionea sediminis]|uniref:group I truncated hemoglobin n=1 Tax=Pleionea sediminis TaxID=2569479 RepID=UPI001185EAAB|nr:group 1 truncated hemoglobin [Pleionea sediminis]
MNKTLFIRMGGEAAVEAAVNRFYDKLLKNKDLIPYFQHISINEQKDKLRNFFTNIMGGPVQTTPKDLREAHSTLVDDGLGDYHVDLFIDYMRDTLTELEVPAELIEEFIELCESYRDDILNRNSSSNDVKHPQN